ncbi:transmembrane protein 101-like [Haliotis rubra]|uniref:transmembrane protein 101-like n=1 Tax=Haliotis rubra TaxID=36100 RepID=UPI001EE5787E|nr:transmembrane protein 101-like [Haliotis rubra]
MATVNTWVARVADFLLGKVPFINALSFLMLLAERAKSESVPPLPPQLIYAHMGVFLICGFLMSAHMAKKEASLVYAGQLIFFSYNFYTNKKLNYGQWQRLQMAVRQVGCVGIYVLVAFIHTKKENRSEPLRRVGEIILGIYLFAYAYILNSSSEYKRGFLHHFLDSDWLRYFITLAIVACALCFLSGYFIRDMSVCAVVMLILVTVVMDLDFDYWTRRGVHFWNQARLLLDSLTAVTGFALFSRVFENRIKTEHYE